MLEKYTTPSPHRTFPQIHRDCHILFSLALDHKNAFGQMPGDLHISIKKN